MKLLEAKQAKDFADTDIEYRIKRIASLQLSLKEEQDAQNTTKSVDNFANHNANSIRESFSSRDIARNSVSS
jgi:hypothetical protein